MANKVAARRIVRAEAGETRELLHTRIIIVLMETMKDLYISDDHSDFYGASSPKFVENDIANNQLTGAGPLGSVGLDWQVGGFAASAPTGSMGSSDGSTSQLVQAMAGFGGGSGAADGLSTATLGAETSQQTLLTTPQHA